jgi:hypothetical protein
MIEYLNKTQEFYLYLYKTEWCPYTKPHDLEACVYAHDFIEFRRSPLIFTYKEQACK